MLKLCFKAESYRKIPSPYGMDNDTINPQSTYIAICNIKDLPDNIPMDTNPREQKLTTQVPKKIAYSLLYNQDKNFHLLNRGIVISAESSTFNNKNGMLTLIFSNLEKHGNVDGGHTYKVILENRVDIEEDKYVRLEIMTGVENYFEDLADARNTSAQVQDKSLAELANKFYIIKKALISESFINNIAYKENAQGNIDVSDIVAILSMFNKDMYTAGIHPIASYSQKSKCIKNYIKVIDNDNNAFIKMQNIMPDIFKLYAYIEGEIPRVYNRDGGKKYGRVKGVAYKEGKGFYQIKFNPDADKICYETPKGFIYPLLAAFRALIEDDGIKYSWSMDINPIKLFDEIAPSLIDTTIDRSRTLGNNPQSVGKDSGHWAQMYQIVQNKLYEKRIEKMEEQNVY